VRPPPAAERRRAAKEEAPIEEVADPLEEAAVDEDLAEEPEEPEEAEDEP
jgi:hypothetical protein